MRQRGWSRGKGQDQRKAASWAPSPFTASDTHCPCPWAGTKAGTLLHFLEQKHSWKGLASPSQWTGCLCQAGSEHPLQGGELSQVQDSGPGTQQACSCSSTQARGGRCWLTHKLTWAPPTSPGPRPPHLSPAHFNWVSPSIHLCPEYLTWTPPTSPVPHLTYALSLLTWAPPLPHL